EFLLISPAHPTLKKAAITIKNKFIIFDLFISLSSFTLNLIYMEFTNKYWEWQVTMTFRLGLLLLFAILTSTVQAQSLKPSVTWAGVGFSGDWESRTTIYPHTSDFFCSNNDCNADNSV